MPAFPITLSVALTVAGSLSVLAETSGPSDQELSDRVATYFKTADREKRSALISDIEQASGGSLDKVARAVERVQLWAPIDKLEDMVSVAVSPHRKTWISVKLPPDYDATKRYPLVLALPGATPNGFDAFDGEWLASLAARFLIAIPGDFACAQFNAPQQSADEPRKWVDALRRRYHLDTDRIYLYGSGHGADAALMLAVMHSDLFASVIVREGVLNIPYRRELLPILLGNLRHTPTHLVWTQPQLPLETAMRAREINVGITNVSATEWAHSANLPISENELLKDETPDLFELGRIMESRRRCDLKEVSHRFRYPGQGFARFLRQRGFVPPVWEGDQIDMVVSPHVDASAYVTSVLNSKLAHLRGGIEGQTIVVTSRKCERVEILLDPRVVDLTKPVRIIYNGKRRFEGRLHPSIATLLVSAYEEWEFQHPAWVRLRMGKKGRVLPF